MPTTDSVNAYNNHVNLQPRLTLHIAKRRAPATPPPLRTSTANMVTPIVTPTPPRKKANTTHPISALPYTAGELGKSAALAAAQLATLGWDNFIRQRQHPSSINPNIASAPHHAATYLKRLAIHGVPLCAMAPPWSLVTKDKAFQCGPHPSAARM
jgi:hypothetical protein